MNAQGYTNISGRNNLNSSSSNQVNENQYIRADHNGFINRVTGVEEQIETQLEQNINEQNDPTFHEAIERQNSLKKNRLEVSSWYFFKSNISLYERSDKVPSVYFTSIAQLKEKYFKGKKRSLGDVVTEAEWVDNAKDSTDNFKIMVDYNTQWNR